MTSRACRQRLLLNSDRPQVDPVQPCCLHTVFPVVHTPYDFYEVFI